MSNDISGHTAWCIVRFANGRFERVRDGYRSAKNAQRGIASVLKEYKDAPGEAGATYSVGKYAVGSVVIQDTFRRYCA